MKTRTKVAIGTSLAILVASLGVAGSGIASGKKEGHGSGSSYGMHGGMGGGHGGGSSYGMHSGMGGGHGGSQGMMRMFDSFDANGDGKVSQSEIDEARAARLASFDANGDASLTLKEYEALWLDAMRERMVDRFQYLDADGDAMVTGAEFAAPYSSAVRFMDRNEDGMLSRDDMKRRHGSMGGSKGGHHGKRMRDSDDD